MKSATIGGKSAASCLNRLQRPSDTAYAHYRQTEDYWPAPDLAPKPRRHSAQRTHGGYAPGGAVAAQDRIARPARPPAVGGAGRSAVPQGSTSWRPRVTAGPPGPATRPGVCQLSRSRTNQTQDTGHLDPSDRNAITVTVTQIPPGITGFLRAFLQVRQAPARPFPDQFALQVIAVGGTSMVFRIKWWMLPGDGVRGYTFKFCSQADSFIQVESRSRYRYAVWKFSDINRWRFEDWHVDRNAKR
jgi:hypothetical protein